MRSLITGVGGFAGQHLAARLIERGDDVTGVARGSVDWRLTVLAPSPRLSVHFGDLTSPEDCRRIVDLSEPERIYLLAATSSVSESFADPLGAINNNVACVVNVLEAARRMESMPRTLVVASCEVYGRGGVDRLPFDEDAPLCPESPYAVSKVAIDLLGYQYHLAYDAHTVRVRPFNHIGPGQSDRFVSARFARQIAECELGLRPPLLTVGNLDAERDFTDVRDVVAAYVDALESGQAGAAYNVGCGAPVSIRNLLDRLVARSRVPVEVREDPELLRPTDAPFQACDATRLRDQTGWRPRIPLDQTLDDILGYWRARVAER